MGISASPGSAMAGVPSVQPAQPWRAWTALGVYVLSTLTASALLLAVQPLSGIDPAALSLVQFGPTLGASATWLFFRKTVAPLLPAAVPARRVAAHALATVTACVMFWLFIMMAALASGITVVGPASVGGVPFAVFLLLQLVGACGEEIGWRGLMQPLLESRITKLAAIVVTGTTWALWHVQAFSKGPLTAACFFVSVVTFAIMLGYLGIGNARQRALVASIGHWLVNIAWYWLAGDNTLDRPQIVFVAAAAILTAACLMAAREVTRRRSVAASASML